MSTYRQIYASSLLDVFMHSDTKEISELKIQNANLNETAKSQAKTLQELTKSHKSLNDKMRQLNQDVQKMKPKDIEFSRNVYGNTYIASGKTEFIAQNGLKISQGANNIIATRGSGPNQLWNWYRLIDGLYALGTNSGRMIGANIEKTIAYRPWLGTHQRWRRIQIGKNKCLLLSFHNTYLSINNEGYLYLSQLHYPGVNSVWTDTIQN